MHLCLCAKDALVVLSLVTNQIKMKMKGLKRFALLMCAVLSVACFTACDDDTQEDMYTIQVGEMSEAYTQNTTLNVAVGVVLAGYLTETGSELRTEKEAKRWFEGACEKVEDADMYVNTIVVIKPNTWVELKLVNSRNAVVKKEKVDFD